MMELIVTTHWDVIVQLGGVKSLGRIFSILATTGELPQLDRPRAPKNISYNVEISAPLLRCHLSGDQEITELLKNACVEMPRQTSIGMSIEMGSNCTVNKTDLTYNLERKGINIRTQGQIAYFGATNTSEGSISIAFVQFDPILNNLHLNIIHAKSIRPLSQPPSISQTTFNHSKLPRFSIRVLKVHRETESCC